MTDEPVSPASRPAPEAAGREPVATAGAPQPAGAYSQGLVAGGLLHTAGFGPQDPVTGRVPETIGEQTRQVLRNVGAVLGARGLSFAHVVKVTVHLAELRRDFGRFDAAYREFVTPPYPVRTTVGSELMDILVEIDVVAAVPE